MTAPQAGDRIVPGTDFVISASATGNATVGPVTEVEFFMVPNKGAAGPVALPGAAPVTTFAPLGDRVTFVQITNAGSLYVTEPTVTISDGAVSFTTTAILNSAGEVVGVRLNVPGNTGFNPSNPLTVEIAPPPNVLGLPTGVQATGVAGFSIGVTDLTLSIPGYDAAFPPVVTVSPPALPGGTPAVVRPVFVDGLLNLEFRNRGTGYTSNPTITVASPRAQFSVGTVPLYPFVQVAQLPSNDRYTLYAVSSYLNGPDVESGDGATGPIVIGEQGVVPTVKITAPTNTTGFLASQSILISAEATFDPPKPAEGDAVAEFELFVNGVSSGTSTTPVFTYVPATAGFYAFVVRATTLRGLVADSSPQILTVTQGKSPTIKITAPIASPDPGNLPPPAYEMILNETVTIRADVKVPESGANAESVEFLFNGKIVESISGNTSYNFTWTADNAGRYLVSARVIDNSGNIVETGQILINVTQGEAPTVKLTEPTDDSNVTLGVPVVLSADVKGKSGTVTQVEFLANGEVVGSVAGEPFVTFFTPTALGPYEIFARATDSLGNVTDSTKRTVTAVTPPDDAPVVSLSRPPGQVSLVGGSELYFNATASNADGKPLSGAGSGVTFLVNGVPVKATECLGDKGYAATYTIGNAPATYVVQAIATDGAGNKAASNPATITTALRQNDLPQVRMLELLPGTPVFAGGTVNLRAEAFFPAAASANAVVEFYANGVYLGDGAVAGNIYSYTWNVPADLDGSTGVRITARAAASNSTNSSFLGSSLSTNLTKPINLKDGELPIAEITVPALPTTSPVNFTRELTARAEVADSTIDRVDFYANGRLIGSDTGYPYTVQWTPTATGVYEVGVIATAASGLQGLSPTGKTITVPLVIGPTPDMVEITAPVPVAPDTSVDLKVNQTSIFRAEAEAAAGRNIARVDFLFNDFVVQSLTAAPYQFEWTAVNAGQYIVVAYAYDDLGNLLSSNPLTVNVTQGAPPTVSITSPNTPLRATVSAAGVTITSGKVTSIVPTVQGGGYTVPPRVTITGGGGKGAKAYATISAGKVTSITVTDGGAGYTGKPTVTLGEPVLPVGIPVTVSINAAGVSGSITTVDVLVNNTSVGVLQAEPYITTFTPPSEGVYNILARATDSLGNIRDTSVTVNAKTIAPIGKAPVVTLSQPTGANLLVAGSTVYLNATVSDPDGTVNPDSVQFIVDGAPLNEVLTRIGNVFASPLGIDQAGKTYTLRAVATDNDGNTSISGSINLASIQAQNPFPTAEILPLTPGTATTAGGVVPLRAQINTFGAEAEGTGVQFYADGVFIGNGVVQTDGTYLLRWRTPTTPDAYAVVQARVIAPNATVSTGGGGGGQSQQTVFSASTLSSNFLSINTLPGVRPQVTMVLPADNTSVGIGQILTLRAEASSTPGVGIINITNGGSGYTTTPQVTIAAPPSPGTRATATARITNRVVTSIVITDGGSGYTSVPSVTIAAPPAGGVRAQATARLVTPTVSSVQFYANGEAIGDPDVAAPYEVTFTPASQGTYSLSAVATSPDGLVSLPATSLVVVNKGQGPEVTVTNPTSSSSLNYIPGTVIPLSATANPRTTGARITSMQFFVNGVSIGEPDTEAPFTATYRIPGAGPYKITALSTDSFGNIGSDSVDITSTVPIGGAPVVSISYPTPSPLTLVSGSEIFINANAIVPTGRTAKEIRFYVDGILKATVSGKTTASYRYRQDDAADHLLLAEIVDSANNASFSPALLISAESSVSFPQPSITLQQIQGIPNAGVTVGTSVFLIAEANAGANAVQAVDFYADGMFIGTVPNTADPGTGRFQAIFEWQPPSAGTFSITASARGVGRVINSSTEDRYSVVSNARSLKVINPSNPPTVRFLTPDDGAKYAPNSQLVAAVSATAASGRRITRVNFYLNGAPVFEDTSAPFTYSFTLSTPGEYDITAVATDSSNQTASDARTITAQPPSGSAPVVLITQPLGEVAYVYNSEFFVNIQASDRNGSIADGSTQIYLNGVAQTAEPSGFGNIYSRRFTASVENAEVSLSASARDNDNNVSFVAGPQLLFVQALNPLPSVEMLPLLPEAPQDAGGVVRLRARANFPQSGSVQQDTSRVEFYANGGFIGTATRDATDLSLYTFNWKTPASANGYIIEARAVGLNFQTNVDNNNVVRFFSSVISTNPIQVNTIPGNPPFASITSPSEGSVIGAGQSSTISADAFVQTFEVLSRMQGTISTVSVQVGQTVTDQTEIARIRIPDGTVFAVFPPEGSSGKIAKVLGPGATVIIDQPLAEISGGVVNAVEFYVNGVLVGTDQSAPYSVNYTPPSVGIYYLSAVAQSNAGLLGVSKPVAVSASLGKAPVVSLTTGSSATATALITSSGAIRSPLTVTQSGSGYMTAPSVTFVGGGGSGAVGKADLKVTRIAIVRGGSGYTSAPQVTLSEPAAGGVRATARAIVQGGAVTEITMTNPGRGYLTAPTVTLTGGGGRGANAKAYGGVNRVVVSPRGSKYKTAPTVVIAPPPAVVGGTETLIASATDEDGSIRTLEFLVNGVVQDTKEVEPYIYQLPLTSAGTFTLQARATDNRGNIALSNVVPLLVVQGLPPVVSIVSPTNGAVIPAGRPIPLSANASDPDGSISSVTFTVNGTQVGEPVTQAPYDGSFTPTSPGNYSIVAVALDSSGNRTQSVPVVVTVPATSIKVSVTSPQSKTPPESFTVGTSVFLSASASTTAGATITGVQFLVNGSPVGAAVTSAPYAASFVPTSTGTYTVRARATDTSGNGALSSSVTFEAKSPQPGVVPPTVVLSAPNESATFTAGSTIYLNYEAFLAQGNTLSEARLFVNGAPLVGVAKIGPTGRSFGAPLVFGADGTYTVYAQIRDSAGNTASSSPTVLTARAPQKTPPAVWMEPFQLTKPYLAVGQPVLLRAKANFGGNELPAVEFYANNVFIGTATEGAKNRDGTTSYTLNWVPEVSGSKIALTARATGSNFVTGAAQRIYASVVSRNTTVPAVTGLTIHAVPSQPKAGTPEAFVKDIYPILLYRDAVYSDWKYYVDQLKSKRMSQADVVIALMGFNSKTRIFDAKSEYGTSVAMAFAPFARLGLAPNNAALEAFLSNLEGDFTPLPLSTYPGVGGAPYGATLGLGKAMQDLINSPAFTRKYPNVQAMTSPQFVSWLRTTMFSGHLLGSAAGLQTVSGGLMNDPLVSGFSQGAAAAFYSRFVLAAYTAPERTFQLQLNSTALRYQLSGKWTPSYGVKNPYSKAVVTKLLQEFPVGVQALSRSTVTTQALTPVGTYTGTVARSSLNNSNGGAIQLTVNNKGAVTGAITMNGQTSNFRAVVSQDGKIEATATSKGSKASYRLSLQVAAPGTTKARIAGSISSGTKKATLLARLNSWSNSNPAQDYSGSYTIQLKPSPAGSDQKSGIPSGARFAEIQVSRDGSVQLVGQLATNMPFSWAGKLGADGSVLLHANIKNQGSLMGNLAFTKDKNSKLSASGSLVWQKPKVGFRPGFKLSLRPVIN